MSSVNELSAKLLQGWTLLAENCPHVGCHVPLLRNKKMETYCVDCKKFNPTEDDEESKTPAAAAATTTTAAAAASGSSYYDDADFHATRESLYSNGDAANTASASSSSSAAAAASASSASASAASPASSASAHARLSASIARSPPKPKGASSSSKIAEKLLAGWTLMNDTCPTSDCFVPLCKNRQGQMFCVGCEAFILSPEEAQAQGLDISGADAAPASPARPADAMFADVASMYAEATGGASSPRQQPLSPVRSPPKSKFKQPRRTGGGGGGGGGVGGGVQLSNVERRGAAGARGGAASGAQQSMDAALEDTLQALADKLDASRRALGETTDMGACREILSFMNEIMETVDRVQRSVE